MTIIVFLVDTSASMNQRCYLGTSLLDVAKSAIETFLKIRARDPASRGMDRYMLLSFEESPHNVKAGWRESQAVFQSELRSLRASGTTRLGEAVGGAFHLLNINRLQSGIDNYGQGRYPHWLEPAVILTITDGDRLSPSKTEPCPEAISVPTGGSLGSELTVEPFRWDQRLFGLVLRLPGHGAKAPPCAGVPSDVGPLDPMCEVTGGRSYAIHTHKALAQCLESLAAKMASGIVISLEKWGPDPPPAKDDAPPLTNGTHAEPKREPEAEADGGWESTRRMIFVPRSLHKGYQGFWPIPEAYFPNIQASALAARTAHPVIRFSCEPNEPSVLADFPWDKYELEPSPLTLFLLNRRQPNVAWQVFVEGSGRDASSIVGKSAGLGAPVGYLKASSDLRVVNLILMPYNYPTLLPLLDELRTKLKSKVSGSWRLRFEAYLRQIPPYYYEPLRKALARMGLTHIMPDRSQDLLFSFSVNNYLLRVKHKAKEEFEKLVSFVSTRTALTAANPPVPGIRPHFGLPLLSDGPSGDADLLSRLVDGQEAGLSAADIRSLQAESNPFKDVRLFLRQPRNPTLPKGGSAFRNAFDIPRAGLLAQIRRMRTNLDQELAPPHLAGPARLSGGLPGTRLNLAAAANLHSLPVGQMGNYQDYLSRLPAPLRELEEKPLRAHAFGNPFKMDKNLKNVDEINMDGVGSAGTSGGGASRPGPKRGELSRRPSTITKRRGLPKGYKYKRRRVDSETGSVLSDSGVETDSDVSGYSSDASDRLFLPEKSEPFANKSQAPPSPGGSPPRKRPRREQPVDFLDDLPQPSSSVEAIAHPVPVENLFKNKTKERISLDKAASAAATEELGLSSAELDSARAQMRVVIRTAGPVGVKEARLRELWEWGVDLAEDRAALLDAALCDAARFKAHRLVAALQAERDRLPSLPNGRAS